MNVGELAEHFEVSYDLANDTVIDMREEGRLRFVDWAPVRVRVYQLADPASYDPEDPSTHARRPTQPRWG